MNEQQKLLHLLAETVKQQRKLRGWTQNQLAKKIGRSASHISHIEKMTAHGVCLLDVQSLAIAFNLPLSAILSPSDATLSVWNDYMKNLLEFHLGVKLKEARKKE